MAFIAIQQQQAIYCDGNDVTPLRTGYEQIVAQRTTSIFASAAPKNGTVVGINKYAIHVKYEDGEEERFPLGIKHGVATGVTYPHDLVTNLNVGDSFKVGDTIAYNRKYFKMDRLCPGQAVWKSGVLCVIAFIDDIDTLEDGCAITAEVARKFNTQTTEVRTLQVAFDQSVHGLVKVGDHVDLDTILCTIEDPESAGNQLFDDVSIDTLRRIEAKTPRAKVVGTVSKIECFYHGDFEDLSENLQALASRSDKERARQAKALGEPAFTGQVDTSFRIRGNAMDPDMLAIRVYIDHDIPAGAGDKGVIANQMKTIISRVYETPIRTASGLNVDLLYGNTSVEERMVLSPKIIGAYNLTLSVLSKHLAAVAKGKAAEKAPKAKQYLNK